MIPFWQFVLAICLATVASYAVGRWAERFTKRKPPPMEPTARVVLPFQKPRVPFVPGPRRGGGDAA